MRRGSHSNGLPRPPPSCLAGLFQPGVSTVSQHKALDMLWKPFAQLLISTALVCKLKRKTPSSSCSSWCTWKVLWIYGRIMRSTAPIYELIICTKPPSKHRRLPFDQELHLAAQRARKPSIWKLKALIKVWLINYFIFVTLFEMGWERPG